MDSSFSESSKSYSSKDPSTHSPALGKRRGTLVDGSESSDSSSVVIISTAMAGCATVLSDQSRKKRRRPNRRPLSFAPLTFGAISDFYGPEMFRRAFRMTRPTFEILLSEVSDLLERRVVSGCSYRRETVPPDIRLSITLRILAGASYFDLSLVYQVKTSTIFDTFTDTCDALNERLRLEGLPKTKRALERIAKRFQTSRKEPNPLFGCEGAVDGICVKIKKPMHSENPASFYSRKGFYALPVQAICDSDYIFRYCSIVCTGATHDALAFSVSGLKKDIDSGILGIIFFIVGDEAYVCTEEMITPFPAGNADFDQMNFNYFLSSLRIHIEQAFGLLVARWRILKGGLHYSVKRCADIICLLMKLHNFCIRYDGKESLTRLSEEEKEQLDVDIQDWYRSATEIANEFRGRVQRAGSRTAPRTKRDSLVKVVKKKGMRRPNPVPFTAVTRLRD